MSEKVFNSLLKVGLKTIGMIVENSVECVEKSVSAVRKIKI